MILCHGNSFEEAQELEKNARKDVEYFINKNLESINEWIEAFTKREDYHGKYIFYKHHKYTGGEKTHLKNVNYCWYISELEDEKRRLGDVEILTEKEIQNVLEGYKQVKQAFMKRLETYLKKYGLSKLNTWTYWADE